MSRFGYSNTFSSTKSSQECLEAAHEALSRLGCRPLAFSQDRIEISGKIGMGWAIRLVGGLISPATWFPVKVSVAVRDGGNWREVMVRADEDFGFGSLFGIENKMRGRCNEVGNQICSLLETHLG